MYEINLNMPVKVRLTEEGKLRADDYGLCVLWKEEHVEMTLLNFIKIFGGEENLDEFGNSKYIIKDSVFGNFMVDEKTFGCYVTNYSKEMETLNNVMYQEENKDSLSKNIVKYLRLHVKHQEKHISKEIKELEEVKERILRIKQKQKTKIR